MSKRAALERIFPRPFRGIRRPRLVAQVGNLHYDGCLRVSPSARPGPNGFCRWLSISTFLALAAAVLSMAQASEPPAVAKPKPKSSLTKGPVADNNRCLVCHINFEEEQLALAHAKANLACVKCHGPSTAHSSDEDNVTPPDIMFPRDRLNAACLKCHPRGKLSQVHQSFLAGKDAKSHFCTDCHGEHRVPHRTRKWDKTTGKLLPVK